MRRDAVETAFLRSGAPGAAEVWQRVAALLDRYRSGWLAMYRDACEATHVRSEQSAAVLDLRMGCLDERRLALSALTNIFVAADREVVTRAVDAANALPALGRCADRKQLEEPIEPPRDEATRKRVEDLRARAAITKALNDTGKRDEARDMARAAARGGARGSDIARSVAGRAGWRLVEPVIVGTLPHGGGAPSTRRAYGTSLAVGRDDLAAEAAIALVGAVGGYLGRFDEGRAWARLASAILDRHRRPRAPTFVAPQHRSLARPP